MSKKNSKKPVSPFIDAVSVTNLKTAVTIQKEEKERKDAFLRGIRAVCYGNEVYVASSSKKGWKLYKIISGEEKEKSLFVSTSPRRIRDIAIFKDDLFLLLEDKQDEKTIFEVYTAEIGDTKTKPVLVGTFSANTKVTLEPFRKYPGGWVFWVIKEELKQEFPYGGLFAFSFNSKQLLPVDMDIEHTHFKQVGNYVFFEDGTPAVLP